MDIFKKMGITVGVPSLIQEINSISKSEESDKETPQTQIVRKGFGSTARDNLEAQLSKGFTMEAMTDDELTDPEEKKKAKEVSKELKNTHGEDWHTDNDKQVEGLQSTSEVIVSQFENEKPVKISFKSQSVLDALDDLCKSEKKVSIPKKEFVAEHKKLVNVLNSPSKKDDKEEAKDQKKELQAIDKCKKSLAEVHDALDDIIKSRRPVPHAKPSKTAPRQEKDPAQAKQERQVRREMGIKSDRPEGVSKKEFEKLANLHENSEGVAEKQKQSPYLKSMGPGGVILDFGYKTGNPIADNATAILNQHADPIQAQNAKYHATSHSDALKQYVTKGEAAFMQTASHFGNINNGWDDQLGKSTDQQVKEAFEKGVFNEDKNAPALNNQFNKTELRLGGEVIKATSETDAALIEMMRSQMEVGPDDGTTVTLTSARGVTIDI